jgi:hypothetical protein
MWVWVDDFLIHGPTHTKTLEALNYFLDTTVDIGMLCHPKKLTPPAQVVKYCGFLFDTTGVPCLRIPVAKRERAYAIIKHMINAPLRRKWSRLSLAVAAGILESLVEATPRRIGHTYLRRFHSLVHPEGGGTGIEPYLTTTSLTPDIRVDLVWWATFLAVGGGRFARVTKPATLVPTWGDGSGTGTGGTYQQLPPSGTFEECQPLKMWKGKWSPIVSSFARVTKSATLVPTWGNGSGTSTGGTYQLPPSGTFEECQPLKMWKGKWSPIVCKYSSNWKELQTLNLTLQRLEEDDPASIRGTTVFYFTDNSTVYWISAAGSSKSPALHFLIEEIRTCEI